MQLNKVLVPIDFSDRAVEAVRRAASFAELFDGQVVLLHVMPPPAYIPLDLSIWGDDDEEHSVQAFLEKATRREMKAFVDKLPESLEGRVKTQVELGVPHETIVRVAEQNGFDLITLATHGRSGVRHFLMGSVAEKVLRAAPCPVLTIRIP